MHQKVVADNCRTELVLAMQADVIRRVSTVQAEADRLTASPDVTAVDRQRIMQER